MEKLNSEELTKKVQEVKESKKQFLGGGKFKEKIFNGLANVCDRIYDVSTEESIIVPSSFAVGLAVAGVLASKGMHESSAVLIGVGTIFSTMYASVILGDKLGDVAEVLRNKAKALSEKRKASEVKEEVSANAPAEKASETPSKPKASKSQADKAMQTLMKNKQLARV